MKSKEFLAWLANETNAGPHRHLIHPPASRSDVRRWGARHPGLRLPEDLLELFGRANGVGLFVQESEPTGAWRVHGLDELKPFGLEVFSDAAPEGIPPTWLAVGLDYDCSDILTLETADGRYACLDHLAEPSEFAESVVANSVETLLDWLHELVLSEMRDRDEL